MTQAKRRYEVQLWEDTIYVRDFEATSKEDAIAQAKACYAQHLTSGFEDCGSEPTRWEAEEYDA